MLHAHIRPVSSPHLQRLAVFAGIAGGTLSMRNGRRVAVRHGVQRQIQVRRLVDVDRCGG